ncbi:MAG: hypothetical protein F2652_01700, partial [Actinobacteria bacterium]|nr:hypothetical protein [Actinomycetota bacterium]
MRIGNTRVTRVLSRVTAGLSVITLSASLLGLSAATALAAGCQQGTDYTLTTSGGEYILTFTNSAVSCTWTPPQGLTNMSVTVVGGGGGGGGNGGGGGGGGGLAAKEQITIANTPITISVGAGGSGGAGNFGTIAGNSGTAGSGSSFSQGSIALVGGGGSGGFGSAGTDPTVTNFGAGGAGGASSITAPTGINANQVSGASGGRGAIVANTRGQNGSEGNPNAITTNSTIYGSGGGGGDWQQTSATTAGGRAGTGAGFGGYGGTDGANAAVNLGGGGGGGRQFGNRPGGNGGSGAVILRFTPDAASASAPNGLALATASDSGQSNADRITNVPTPVINVAGLETGTAVTITATRPGATSVSCTFTATSTTGNCAMPTLSDGQWTITAKQADSWNNISAPSASIVVTIDTTAPLLTLTPVTNSIQVSTANPAATYVLTANEAIDCSTLSATSGTDFDLSGLSSITTVLASGNICNVNAATAAPSGARTQSTLSKAASFSVTDIAGNAQTLISTGNPATEVVTVTTGATPSFPTVGGATTANLVSGVAKQIGNQFAISDPLGVNWSQVVATVTTSAGILSADAGDQGATVQVSGNVVTIRGSKTQVINTLNGVGTSNVRITASANVSVSTKIEPAATFTSGGITYFYNSANGHYYSVDQSARSYAAASLNARSTVFAGAGGYLATVTSESEFNFLTATGGPADSSTATSPLWLGAIRCASLPNAGFICSPANESVAGGLYWSAGANALDSETVAVTPIANVGGSWSPWLNGAIASGAESYAKALTFSQGQWDQSNAADANKSLIEYGNNSSYAAGVITTSFSIDPLVNTAAEADYSMVFNGNQYAEAPNQVIPNSGAFTVETWVFDRTPTSVASSTNFVTQGVQGGNFYLGSTAVSGTTRNVRISDTWSDTGYKMPQNQWVHLAVVADGAGAAYLYVNGVLAATKASGFSNPAPQTSTYNGSGLRVGRQYGAPYFEYAYGRVDEVKIWKAARSASDIATDMHTYTPVDSSNLLAYYDFNEGSGSTVYNRATNASTGSHLILQTAATVQNAATSTSLPTWVDNKEITNNGTKTVVNFPRTYITASGGYKLPTGVTSIDVFTVGGGGGGGENVGGGGGGGASTTSTGVSVTSGALINVKVGQGGRGGKAPGQIASAGTRGDTSTVSGTGITSVLALGGLGGLGGGTASGGGAAGGAGGGAGGNSATVANTAGNAGLTGSSSSFTGVTRFYGGGGAGSAWNLATSYVGGNGGGGASSAGIVATNNVNNAFDAIPNTGGGGGGGNVWYGYGGDGAAGTVAISYLTASAPALIVPSEPSVPTTTSVFAGSYSLLGYTNPINGYVNGEQVQAVVSVVNNANYGTVPVLSFGAVQSNGTYLAAQYTIVGQKVIVSASNNNSITFVGSQDAVNAALSGVAVYTYVATPIQVRLTVSPAAITQGDIYYSATTQHFYKVVSSAPFGYDITWTQAKLAAEGMAFGGVKGYLATILSSGENSEVFTMVTSQTGASRPYWLGASDAAVEGAWSWSGGDNTSQFWAGVAAGAAKNGLYTNWRAGQPDAGSAENYLAGFTDAGWYDTTDLTAGISTYVVEFAPEKYFADTTLTFITPAVIAESGVTATLGFNSPIIGYAATEPIAVTLTTNSGVVSVIPGSLSVSGNNTTSLTIRGVQATVNAVLNTARINTSNPSGATVTMNVGIDTLPLTPANITNVTSNGSTVTFTAANNFSTGQIVQITGLPGSAYNLANATIASANASSFTVTSNAARTAAITGITSNGTSITYTANNSFAAGDTVTITGVVTSGSASISDYNLVNAVIASATSTTFTINSSVGKTAGITALTRASQTITLTTGALASLWNTTETATVIGLRSTLAGFTSGVNVARIETTTAATSMAFSVATGINAAITRYSRNGSVVTFTANNTFTVGEYVTIAGATGTIGANYNISTIRVDTATSTSFSVTSPLTLAITAVTKDTPAVGKSRYASTTAINYLSVGDSVTVTGFATAANNVTNGLVTGVTSTYFDVVVSTSATTITAAATASIVTADAVLAGTPVATASGSAIATSNGSAVITGAVRDGTRITYTATNSLTPGQVVTIAGVNPAAFNFASAVVDSATATSFSVLSSATGVWGASSSTAQVFFNGSVVTYGTYSGLGGTATAYGSYALNGIATPTTTAYSSATGHFYSRQATAWVWSTANSQAPLNYFGGAQGYLATLNAAGESTTVQSVMQPNERYWVGASDSVSEGTWRWMGLDSYAPIVNNTTVAITAVSASGARVTYTAANNFQPGQVVNISGITNSVAPNTFNLSGVTIDSATSTSFSVLNSATGAYSSGGAASLVNRAFGKPSTAGISNNYAYANYGPLSGTTPVAITAAVGTGTRVTYTTSTTPLNGFAPGQIVTITGILPQVLNLTNVVVDTATANTFSVLSNVIGNWSSGGFAYAGGLLAADDGGLSLTSAVEYMPINWSMTKQVLVTPQATGYQFSTLTFTPCGATGTSGPALSSCTSSYTATVPTPWIGNTNYFNVTSGIQTWTVPRGDTYTVTIAGAKGGQSTTGAGYGAKYTADIYFAAGEKIKILVGQAGAGYVNFSGGGGGTFIVSATDNAPIFIAGGGGGAGNDGLTYASANAPNSTIGGVGATNTSAAATAGAGGASGANSAGGGGYRTDGLCPTAWCGYGQGLSFLSAGVGGASSSGAGYGGFGGGASGYNSTPAGGGGGGGYSGGSGGNSWTSTGVNGAVTYVNGAGGGGSSYFINGLVNASYETNTASNGYVTITAKNLSNAVVVPAPATSITPVVTDIPAISGNLAVGDVLTATSGNWSGSPMPSFVYQWQNSFDGVNYSNISGAAGSTYTLTSFDLNKRIRVQVTAINFIGRATSTSASTEAIMSIGNQVFTSCGLIGTFGPATAAQCKSGYGNTTWAPAMNNATTLDVNSGFQYWKVPVTGTYRITAIGSSGSSTKAPAALLGSYGAQASGDVQLIAGQVLKIAVGQGASLYSTWYTPGGGGTFVTKVDNTPLVVAGGGGGVSPNVNVTYPGYGNAPTSNNYRLPSTTVAGFDVTGALVTDGGYAIYSSTNPLIAGGSATTASGGTVYTGYSGNGQGAGGGFATDGTNPTGLGWSTYDNGKAFINGAAGGAYANTVPTTTNQTSNFFGGFGGGGGADAYAPGGGGGWAGGSTAYGNGDSQQAAGGGGSFVAASAANASIMLAPTLGSGRVGISLLSGNAGAPVLVTAPVITTVNGDTATASGAALTVNTGTYTNTPTSYSYRWLSCPVSPATGAAAGCSPIITAPTEPLALTATSGSGQASFAWSAPASNGGSAITGYTVTVANSDVVSASTIINGLNHRVQFDSNVADLYGATTSSTGIAYAAAKVGNGAVFNGTNSYSYVLKNGVNENFSLNFWMKTTQTGINGTQWYQGTSLLDSDVSSHINGYGLSLIGSSVAFGVGDAAGLGTTIKSTTAVNDGAWHLVSATRNATTGLIKLYVDGTLQAQASASTGSKTATSYIYMGYYSALGSNYLNGMLDDVRVYSRELTTAEIAFLLNQGGSCTTSGALACTVTGLSNGATYLASLTATNVAGVGPISTSATFVPGGASGTAPATQITPSSPYLNTFQPTSLVDQKYLVVEVTATNGTASTIAYSAPVGPIKSTFTFTSCGVKGPTGPGLSNCNTAYAGGMVSNISGVAASAPSITAISGGIQYWTVPVTGTYRVTTQGASGASNSGYNNGGYSSVVTADVKLTKGQVLKVLVGQNPLSYTTWTQGGGGGSFVTQLDNAPLVISGGGAGTYTSANASTNPSTAWIQIPGSTLVGGFNVGGAMATAGGNAWSGNYGSTINSVRVVDATAGPAYYGDWTPGAGGGFVANLAAVAAMGTQGSMGGQGYLQGGIGGQANYLTNGYNADWSTGGFGGGGGGWSYDANGGGGWIGGAATYGGSYDMYGGAGGSFVANGASNVSIIKASAFSSGQVSFALLTSVANSTATPAVAPVFAASQGSGAIAVGDQISITAGTNWSNNPDKYTYTLYSCTNPSDITTCTGVANGSQTTTAPQVFIKVATGAFGKYLIAQVTAINSFTGVSGSVWSNASIGTVLPGAGGVADATIPVPAFITSTLSSTTVTLMWSATNFVAGYRIEYRYRPVGSTIPWENLSTQVLAANIPYGTTSFTWTPPLRGYEYQFNIRGTNTLGDFSEATATATNIISLGNSATAPRNLRADTFATTQGGATPPAAVTLTWEPPATTNGYDLLGYRIEIAQNSAFNSANQVLTTNTGTPNQLTYQVPGLQNGVTYWFRVAAITTSPGTAAIGLYSTTFAMPTDNARATTSLTATAADRSVALTWAAPTPGGGTAGVENGGLFTGYSIEYSTSADFSTNAVVASPNFSSGTSFTINGLANGTLYYFRIREISSTGLGYPAVTSATPYGMPTAPLGLSAVAGEQRVDLSWQAPADNGGSPILGYAIEATINYGGNYWTVDCGCLNSYATVLTPNTGTTDTRYTVSGLANGTQYVFRVSAVTAASLELATGVNGQIVGVGAPAVIHASPVSLASNPFTTLTATPGNASVVVAWSGAASSGRTIVGYQVEQSSDGVNFTTVMSYSDGTSYTATGLVNGTTYAFRITPMTNAGAMLSRVVTATPFTMPGAPDELRATPGANMVALSWKQPNVSGGAVITGYRVSFATGTYPAQGNQTSNYFLVPASQTSYEFRGLSNGTVYGFMVQTVTARGESTPASLYGAVISAVPSGVPSAPSLLMFSSVTPTSATLSWSAPALTNGRPVVAYKVERSTGSDWVTLTSTTTNTTWPITGLTPNVTSFWRVTAINSNGLGAAALASLMPPTTSSIRPNAPLKLSVVSGDRYLDLSWQKPLYINPSAYRVEYGTGTGYGIVVTNNTTATSIRIAGLNNGQVYYVKVTAYAGSLYGGESTGEGIPYAKSLAPLRIFADPSLTVSGR